MSIAQVMKSEFADKDYSLPDIRGVGTVWDAAEFILIGANIVLDGGSLNGGRDYGAKAEFHGSLAYAGKVKRINVGKRDTNASFMNSTASSCRYITLAHKLQLAVIFIEDIDSFLGYHRATNCEALTNMKKEFHGLRLYKLQFDTFMDADTLFPMVVRSLLLLDVEMVERVVRLQFCSHAS
ncbi:hypothetical protein C5167_023072 [Papaver somniferum]|uniref:Uncharacterized protein n=1 Tax=Papaver somniferum TaxID=3469 RepID=A0A4Y7JMV5_PAPSO|nr:hypothetical protein C5167_023072 [Papaver somniferum]